MPSAELVRLQRLGWEPKQVAAHQDGIWHLGDAQQVNYPDEGFAAIEPGAGGNYWFDHRAQAVADALRDLGQPTLWEVGAGSGAVSLRLEAAGFEVVAVEPLLTGAKTIAARSVGPVFCGLLHDLKLPTGALSVVGLFDVVEHLDDPAAVLLEVRRVLAPDGLIVLTVPAMNWLWSDEDNVAGHQTRYTRRTLRALVLRAGFTEVRSAYLYASLVAPAAAVRALPYRLGRRRTDDGALAALESQLDPSPLMDRVVRAVLSGETRIAERVSLPFGTSIIGVYRR